MRLPLLLLTLVVACSGPTSETTSTTMPSTTTSVPETSTTTEPPPPCPPPPYELGSLPPAVEPAQEGDTTDEPDEFTSIGGTNIRIWVGPEGETRIALVRGALPPRQFPAERGEVDVAGSRGVAGPYPDGRWVVAWFNEPGERCDEYTMVFYPPVAPAEVEETLSSLTRTPG